jgi:hypothetical protein
MFYRLLGMAVWHGGKLFLRRRYGRTYVPKSVVAGAALAVIGGLVLLLARHSGSSAS